MWKPVHIYIPYFLFWTDEQFILELSSELLLPYGVAYTLVRSRRGITYDLWWINIWILLSLWFIEINNVPQLSSPQPSWSLDWIHRCTHINSINKTSVRFYLPCFTVDYTSVLSLLSTGCGSYWNSSHWWCLHHLCSIRHEDVAKRMKIRMNVVIQTRAPLTAAWQPSQCEVHTEISAEITGSFEKLLIR